MSRRLALLVGLAALVGAISAASLAVAAPPATSSVAIEIQAQHLTGPRPDGSTAHVQIKAVVQGEDASSLTGEIRVFGAGGAHGYGPVTGSQVGDVVTLSGVLTESNIGLVGTPLALEANNSGAIALTLGPFTSGAFVGQTIVVDGVGTVKIKTN